MPAAAPNARLYFLVTRSPLHVGCGDSLGDIDKPTLRNVVTRHPMVPGSMLKGCLRGPAPAAWALPTQEPGLLENSLFGREGADGTGMLCPQDASLLLLPVACLAGGWAWVTCPAVLHRMARAAGVCALPASQARIPDVPLLNSPETAVVRSSGSPLVCRFTGHAPSIVLNEEVLALQTHDAAQAWAEWIAALALPGEQHSAWRELMHHNFAIVSNAVFDHLCAVALDVRARNRIADDGVAQDHHLWREECVPEEAVFFGVLAAQRVESNPAGLTEAQALALPQPLDLQLGGKATVGYGWTSFAPVAASVVAP